MSNICLFFLKKKKNLRRIWLVIKIEQERPTKIHFRRSEKRRMGQSMLAPGSKKISWPMYEQAGRPSHMQEPPIPDKDVAKLICKQIQIHQNWTKTFESVTLHIKATNSDLVQDNVNTVADRSSIDIQRQDTNCQPVRLQTTTSAKTNELQYSERPSLR